MGRQALSRQISVLRTAGLLLLALIAVSVVLGLILNAADDQSGVSAVRAVVGVLAIIGVLILAGLMASLSRAVLILLESPEGEDEEDAVSELTSESNEAEGG